MPRLYIGNLSREVEERDIKKFFRDYGRVQSVDLKNGYGFVEIDDRRDAEDAIHDLDGRRLLGERIIVEMARSSIRSGDSGSRYWRYDRRDSRDRYISRRPIRSEHRVIVKELSTRVSWQDLKDLMRKVGDVTFADAHKIRSNEGIVEFTNRSDMKAAIDKFNGYSLYGYKLKVYADRKSGSTRRSRSSRSSPSRRRRRYSTSSRSRRSRSDTRSRSRDHRSYSRKKSKDSRKHKRRSSTTGNNEINQSRSLTRSPVSHSRSKDAFCGSISPSVVNMTNSESVEMNNDAQLTSTANEESETRSKSRSNSKSPSKSKSPSEAESRSSTKSPAMSKSHSNSED